MEHGMESEVFRAGVAPGAPSTGLEVKTLLCFLLSRVGEPMTFDTLHEALSENSLVNYFELRQILDELCRLGQVEERAGGDVSAPALYAATTAGRAAGDELERSLPYSVREKAVDAARRALARRRRLDELRVRALPRGDGYTVELAIPDETAGELLCVRVYAPSRDEYEAIRRGFLNAPLTVYKGIMALLTGDEKVLGNIFTEDDEALF